MYLPSEDEWYKAAYYDPTPGAGGGDNYWAHAIQSDTAPTEGTANSTGVISNSGANVANFNRGADWNGLDGNVTTVGSAAAGNYFGTADQAGNVFEWNDGVLSSSSRGFRGGSWSLNSGNLAASDRFGISPTYDGNIMGFRVASVASVPVPEPSAFLVSMLLVSAFLTRRRRSTR